MFYKTQCEQGVINRSICWTIWGYYMYQKLRLAKVGDECVACGCCELVCPKKSIAVHLGIVAKVDEQLCIGCGKCVKACPAAVIILSERGMDT